jgi:uncharacterized protein (TIGR00251 family)
VSFFRWQDKGLLHSYYLQPRTKIEEFVGLHDERLKIRVKAAAIDGKANVALFKFLGGEFGVAKSAANLQSGDSSRLPRTSSLFRLPTPLEDKPLYDS